MKEKEQTRINGNGKEMEERDKSINKTSYKVFDIIGSRKRNDIIKEVKK